MGLNKPFTVDTNVVIYSFDRRHLPKHEISMAVMSTLTAFHHPLPMQVLGEFYAATTRKPELSTAGLDSYAERLVHTLSIIPSTMEDLLEGRQIQKRYGMQYFDSVLIATTRRSGCSLLFSEDMQHGRDYNGVTVLNPFLLPPAELDRLLG